MKIKKTLSNDCEYTVFCFIDLIYERSEEDRASVEKRLKGKLKRRDLPYKQELLDMLRILRNELAQELDFNKGTSVYRLPVYTGYANLSNFDIDRMLKDYQPKYPHLQKETLEHFIETAIYFFYIR